MGSGICVGKIPTAAFCGMPEKPLSDLSLLSSIVSTFAITAELASNEVYKASRIKLPRVSLFVLRFVLLGFLDIFSKNFNLLYHFLCSS